MPTKPPLGPTAPAAVAAAAAAASTAGEHPPPQKQPSKLMQLLGKLRLDVPGAALPGGAAQQAAAPGTGKVELSGRSLLPPGLDDVHVTIFDEEPTSVIAYFLSTRWACARWVARRGGEHSWVL
jgi:hypothetical protein